MGCQCKVLIAKPSQNIISEQEDQIRFEAKRSRYSPNVIHINGPPCLTFIQVFG